MCRARTCSHNPVPAKTASNAAPPHCSSATRCSSATHSVPASSTTPSAACQARRARPAGTGVPWNIGTTTAPTPASKPSTHPSTPQAACTSAHGSNACPPRPASPETMATPSATVASAASTAPARPACNTRIPSACAPRARQRHKPGSTSAASSAKASSREMRIHLAATYGTFTRRRSMPSVSSMS